MRASARLVAIICGLVLAFSAFGPWFADRPAPSLMPIGDLVQGVSEGRSGVVASAALPFLVAAGLAVLGGLFGMRVLCWLGGLVGLLTIVVLAVHTGLYQGFDPVDLRVGSFLGVAAVLVLIFVSFQPQGRAY